MSMELDAFNPAEEVAYVTNASLSLQHALHNTTNERDRVWKYGRGLLDEYRQAREEVQNLECQARGINEVVTWSQRFRNPYGIPSIERTTLNVAHGDVPTEIMKIAHEAGALQRQWSQKLQHAQLSLLRVEERLVQAHQRFLELESKERWLSQLVKMAEHAPYNFGPRKVPLLNGY